MRPQLDSLIDKTGTRVSGIHMETLLDHWVDQDLDKYKASKFKDVGEIDAGLDEMFVEVLNENDLSYYEQVGHLLLDNFGHWEEMLAWHEVLLLKKTLQSHSELASSIPPAVKRYFILVKQLLGQDASKRHNQKSSPFSGGHPSWIGSSNSQYAYALLPNKWKTYQNNELCRIGRQQNVPAAVGHTKNETQQGTLPSKWIKAIEDKLDDFVEAPEYPESPVVNFGIFGATSNPFGGRPPFLVSSLANNSKSIWERPDN